MSTSHSRDLSKKQQQEELRATTAERLEAIVEAAERAAENVIDDAEAQARRYLAQAKAEADRLGEENNAGVSDLIDALLAQAVSLRAEAERLQGSLEAVRDRLHGGQRSVGGQRDEAGSAPEPPRLRAIPGQEETASPAEQRRPDAAGARLLATQLAVSGSSREEIEDRLRTSFDIEDTKAILDAILGPED
jgi:vacuolar-type H+-ATPase subunit H